MKKFVEKYGIETLLDIIEATLIAICTVIIGILCNKGLINDFGTIMVCFGIVLGIVVLFPAAKTIAMELSYNEEEYYGDD